MAKATITNFGIQTGSENTLFATWSWGKSHTDHYIVRWYYATGDGVWFGPQEDTPKVKQATYSIPANAKKVKFIVKPVSTTHKVKKKDVKWWTADWSTEKIHYVSTYEKPSDLPGAPTVTQSDDGYTITATYSNLDVNVKHVQFEILKCPKLTSVCKRGVEITKGYASFSYTLTPGLKYVVRARCYRSSTDVGEWSDYSPDPSTPISTPSASPRYIHTIRAISETEVRLEWYKVDNVKSYEIQWAEKEYYLTSNTESQITSTTVTAPTEAGAVSGSEAAYISGLETGRRWYFRVRGVNDFGNSAWSAVNSVAIGTQPSPPTTWSSSATVITGEDVTLYWIHNSEDGSNLTYSIIELTVDGVTTTLSPIKNEKNDENTGSYVISSSAYSEGAKIQWRVRTKGAIDAYSDYSIQRSIDIYNKPSLSLHVTDSEGASIDSGYLESFPINVEATASPDTQTAIGYHLTVTSNETYETVDSTGNVKMVNKGEAVYSKYFDTSETLSVILGPGDIDLENNVLYRMICTVSMNSGLTAENECRFTVAWADEEYEPDAEIGYDTSGYFTMIRPYCEDANGSLVEDVTLSVYRREFDGTFTEIATGLDNVSHTYVTDPHPALDYARYRIVATSNVTGAISYYDVPGYPVGETSIIIQWNEEWSTFDIDDEGDVSEPPWSGSLLKLPYNIDVSDSYSPDVEMVEYIGRKHPVSYYGTQNGEKSSWSVDIEKDDEETLYALRRLAVWKGDVYVREPSGTGYWAHVVVSFSQTHCELVIPVSLDITRVDGGV